MKNEHSFIRAVHRQLPSWVEPWKIHDSYHGGTLDTCYFGYHGSILFAEYKYDPVLPVREDTQLKKGRLSSLQRIWMKEKMERGTTCFAIFGHGKSGVITSDLGLVEGIEKRLFLEMQVSIETIAKVIINSLEEP